jgi:hypothetical protein
VRPRPSPEPGRYGVINSLWTEMAGLPWQAEASRAAPVENGVFAGHSHAVPGKAQGATRQPPAPHTGHAPIPCPASTRWATAICSDGVAMFADAAYWPPP